MRAVFTRVLAATVLTAVAAWGVPAATASATVANAGTQLSDSYCSAFVDYFTVSFVAEFAAALAKSFSSSGTTDTNGKPPPDPEVIRATFLLVYSPKLDKLSASLSKGGERVLRPVFKDQQAVFAHGRDLLQQAGLTPHQLDAIASAKIDTSSAALQDLTGTVKLDEKKLTKLAKQFKGELAALDKEKGNRRARAAFERAGSQCGAFPSSTVDCTKVLPQSEAATILGDTATQDGHDCAYEGPEPTTGLQPKVGVEVYDGARAYNGLVKNVKNGTAVSGVGDRASSHAGYTAYGNEKTCGRTLDVLAGDRTIAVALCLANDAEVTDAQLIDIAKGVLTRLG
jgi:hypothetical protein